MPTVVTFQHCWKLKMSCALKCEGHFARENSSGRQLVLMVFPSARDPAVRHPPRLRSVYFSRLHAWFRAPSGHSSASGPRILNVTIHDKSTTTA